MQGITDVNSLKLSDTSMIQQKVFYWPCSNFAPFNL